MKEKEQVHIDVIIETPKGSRNKYDFDKKAKAFRLKKILPAGAVFPFDFGFIPGTEGGDADPLDVLVIMDETSFPGCIVECRIIGALKATQSKQKKMVRNDRLIAVSAVSATYNHLREIKNLEDNIREDIQAFFVEYNTREGKIFQPEGWIGASAAIKLIER